jgi:putative transcriptional regulator|tara:strand:+ start:395 stop:1039 length:645 start_codon:yes stop_codon:yes gene_type:complete
MTKSSSLKNELIFEFASGTTNLAKSLMASTYLFLNSKESSIYNEFENYCGEELKNVTQINPDKLTFEDCIIKQDNSIKSSDNFSTNPLNNFIDDLSSIKWKNVFSGFYEHSFKLSDMEKAKLIKMTPGAKVPLHSHNGKEFILVLQGSFCDEYGKYSKGNLQINDSKIKHTPVACADEGCICLTITEKDLVFFGPFAPILNIITFIKSFFTFLK